ncbi:beta-ketoacyl synthase N-terminal-like domain-containing protein, partial [Nonomuraea sp. NPDC047529]|uniref:type I polyketide synthase n=1 Tax=Nonomuraea sp. NPDC047529 TaxID=3155623 RepID=UPI0033C6CE8E
MDAHHGMNLLDTAQATPEPFLIPLPFDRRALATRPDGVPAILRALTPAPKRRIVQDVVAADGDSPLQRRLAGLPVAEQEHVLVSLVRSHAAAVLGHGSEEEIAAGRPFKELGFDSLTSVELRNRLGRAAGVKLPATLVFDHPTPAAVADYLFQRVGTGPAQTHEAKAASAAKPAASTTTAAAAGVGEPIAVVAMACRYPGEITSPEEMWQLLVRGGSGITGLPEDRGWDLERLFDPDPDTPGTTYLRQGGFLRDAAGFDAGFFGISPREAIAIDPQQRVLLETSWEVLERAGIDPDTLKGSLTGVFIGGTHTGYGAGHGAYPDEIEGYLQTGNAGSVMSGRVAYALGLEGPALTVDTACSSSLVAIHLACESLRRGESTLALAGGVTVMATPDLLVDFSRQRGLARDGRCKPFSDDADGTVFSEGVGVLLLERLADAQANGHQIVGVIRGSAVNQDGASNGLSAPNGPSQERVIRQALANAGLTARDIDAVEAHGTGTTLGDPIEAQALLAAYGRDRDPADPLWLGSIKSNFGHSQAAAGVAGVIKMLMAAQHQLLPQTLHADTPTTHVDWQQGQLRLLHQPQPWPHHPNRPRRAGISSFGISGTNAHIIIEQAPTPHTTPPPEDQPNPHTELPLLPITLSARDPQALTAQATRLHQHLTNHPHLTLHDIALQTTTTRTHHEHRAVILAHTHQDLHQTLHHLANPTNTEPPTNTNRPFTPGANLITGRTRPGKTAFLYSGQGTQHPGMGHNLYTTFPTFANALDQAFQALNPHLEHPLQHIMWAKPHTPHAQLLNQTLYTQPALFALQTALHHLLTSWNIHPHYLAGHSLGEITAAHTAGILTLTDAATLITTRARLMHNLPTNGTMTAIHATPQEITPHLTPNVTIAAINTPNTTVISGTTHDVNTITHHFTQQGRKTHTLTVSHAFHSPHLNPILNTL